MERNGGKVLVKVRKRVFNHFGLKVLSLVIAIIVWLVVANVDDYRTTKQITGIEIEFINGDAITSKNKVYETPEGTAVDVVVKGRRKIVENLDSGDFKAVADLSKMSVTNAVAVDVSAISPSVNREITITNTSAAVVVAVENKIERQLPIVVRAMSEVAEGYAIGNRTATPNLITVKGAESVVNTIEEVVVNVEVAGKSRTVTMQAPPVFLDKSGERLDSSKFEYDVEQIETVVEILPMKEIPVKLGTTGQPAEGFMVASIDYQPSSINVVGKAVALNSLKEIVINDIDVTGCDEDLETSIDILDYLPEGVTLVGEHSEIMVKIAVKRVLEKALTLDLEGVNVIGKDDTLEYAWVGGSVSLKIRGLQEDLDTFEVSQLFPSIDLTGYRPGKHTVQLILREVTGIEVLEIGEVEIEITEKE